LLRLKNVASCKASTTMSKSTPIVQLPGMSATSPNAQQQQPLAQPPPSYDAQPPQQAADNTNSVEEADTLREVFNHLHSEAPQRILPPPPQAGLSAPQMLHAPPTAPQGAPQYATMPGPGPSAYQSQHYAFVPQQLSCCAGPNTLAEAKAAAFVAALALACSAVPVSAALDRFLPSVPAKVPCADVLLKAMGVGIAFYLLQKYIR
jgi:hypothetical protein